MTDGYDLELDKEKQPDLWDDWPRVVDFYEMITDFYEDIESVTCYQKDEGCDSEEE